MLGRGFVNQKKKTVKENKKQRKRVYGIHDLLFFPLILGLAFTKNVEEEEKQQEQVQKARETMANSVATRLDMIEEKLEQIAQTSEEDQFVLVSDDVNMDNLVVEGNGKQECFEEIQEEIAEVEQELFSLSIEEEEKDALLDVASFETEHDVSEEKRDNPKSRVEPQTEMVLEEVLNEYHTWLEAQPFQEQFFDVKEKEMEVKGELLIEDETFDVSYYEENQTELKKQLSVMMKMMETSEKELNRVKRQLAQPIETIEKVRTKIEFTSSRLFETVLLSHAVSKSKLNPFSKFILQTMVISHAMKQSRRVVRTTEKRKPMNFENQLYACFSDTRYLETMIDGSIDQCKRLKKEFLLEVSSIEGQVKEYNGMIKQFDEMQKKLQEKKKAIFSLQDEVKKEQGKNRQKQKEYLNP